MATSFNGPLKVYQRRNPTNDGSGNSLVSSAGAVPCVQTFGPYTDPGVSETPNIAYIPAGSQLIDARFYVTAGTSAIGSGTVNVTFTPDGGTGIIVGTIAVPALAAGVSGYATITFTSTASPTINNVGQIGGYLSFGPEGLTAGTVYTISTHYIIRNTDGTITNTGANLSNN